VIPKGKIAVSSAPGLETDLSPDSISSLQKRISKVANSKAHSVYGVCRPLTLFVDDLAMMPSFGPKQDGRKLRQEVVLKMCTPIASTGRFAVFRHAVALKKTIALTGAMNATYSIP